MSVVSDASSAAAPSLAWASDAALRVAFGGPLSIETQRRVHAAAEALRRAPPHGLLDVMPAYTSLLLVFDASHLDAPRVEEAVHRALEHGTAAPRAPGRLVEVPVCYEGDCAPDLDDVARLHGLSRAEAIALHASVEYLVGFLGFSPGFPYLHGLPEGLATPRLDRPRPAVPAGSVAIAGRQAGIYPHATPGGWRLLGRTPLVLFDPRRDPAALLGPGDRVRFVPLSRAAFDAARAERR